MLVGGPLFLLCVFVAVLEAWPNNYFIATQDQLITSDGTCTGYTAQNYTFQNWHQMVTKSVISRTGTGTPCGKLNLSLGCMSMNISLALIPIDEDTTLVKVVIRNLCESQCNVTIKKGTHFLPCDCLCEHQPDPFFRWIEKHSVFLCQRYGIEFI